MNGNQFEVIIDKMIDCYKKMVYGIIEVRVEKIFNKIYVLTFKQVKNYIKNFTY